MADLSCDVLVIGGGATGVCAAYDLARRGLDVILTDMNDLTTGTSGRFHGLLHSGGRYAVRDPESAAECIAENRILRRIAPHIIEDTGGLFVATPNDPPEYVPQWVEACHTIGIDIEEITVTEARRQEPALRPDLVRAFRVPDGAVDGFDLGHAFSRAAENYGARTLIYHKVTALTRTNDGMRATLHHRRDDVDRTVEARWVLNAAGPWAGQVAALAGHDLHVRWSRGVMIAMNLRWVNTVINRLRPPSDGDILVPVGTVSVIGTTAVHVDRPDDNTIEPWEVSRMLDEGEAIIAGFRQARALRAWAGVRPLYEPPEAHDTDSDRSLKRTFSVVRHEPGFTSVVGGKLTTARLMAEKAADDICNGLGIDVPCTTADDPLPTDHPRRYHMLGNRLEALESGRLSGPLICECELITQPQLEQAIAAYPETPSLDDLRRDLRLGMGPCQGGFCGVRAAGILRQARSLTAPRTVESLREFVSERFKGGRPLMWGQHLRQFLLDEMIYRRTLGLDTREASHPPETAPLPDWAHNHAPLPDVRARGYRHVVVIGAGLAGLITAVHAVQAGARVSLLAMGIGRLILTPGWFQVGAFRDHPGVAALHEWDTMQAHFYTDPAGHLLRLPTMLGILRKTAAAPLGLAAGDLTEASAPLIVGFAGWRDFDPVLFAGMLEKQGIPARAVHVDFPGRHDAWDLTPTELAHRFDSPAFRDEVARLVRGRLREEKRVGFPAVLGLHDSDALEDMVARIGLPVFEIPTLPPSVPGTRLFHALRRWLLRHGARVQIGHPVVRAITGDDRVIGVAVASAGRETIVRGDAFILATGGLYGGGLQSDDRGQVWEPIFDLPVTAENDRTTWFRPDLLDPAGHPVHRFGLQVDERLRPLGADGSPAFANLFAAGHLLAGMDTVIEGNAEGLDLASAFAAARSALESLSDTQ